MWWIVILPLGCTEQHGYHLPLATDSLIGYQMALGAANRVGCFIAPVVPYTFSGGELAGTLNVSPHITALYVRDICRSLIQYGMKKILVFFGHGGSENLRDVKEGLKYFLWQEKAFEDIVIAATDVMEPSRTWNEYFKKQDYHAGLVETSVVMYLRPDLVREEMPCDVEHIAEMLREDPDKYQATVRHTESKYEIPHVSQSEEVKIGVMGRPAKSSAALGKKIFKEGVEGLVKIIEEL